MKIAHIAPPWIAVPPKNYGGTEAFIYDLVEEQVARGHEVTLLAPGDARTSARLVSFFPQSLRDSGVIWQSHLKAYYHLYKSVEYVKDRDFDLVHANLSSTTDMYIFPLTAAFTTPRVMTLHSNFPFDRVESWLGDADPLYMGWAASVPIVAISEHSRARNARVYPLNFVEVVHHGLSMTEFQPTVEQPEDFFVWLGHFVPAKGPHLAIEAAKKANVPLVLAGIVDQTRKFSVDFFNELIKPQIDDQQIRYIGPVNLEQKVDLLSRARGLLNPIVWDEPFGRVIIEAMAVGCPVISYAFGAAPELIVHGKTGFLTDDDVDEMAYYIPRIGEIDRRTTRIHIEQNFSTHAMAEKYEEIYKAVVAEAKNVPS